MCKSRLWVHAGVEGDLYFMWARLSSKEVGMGSMKRKRRKMLNKLVCFLSLISTEWGLRFIWNLSVTKMSNRPDQVNMDILVLFIMYI